MYFKHRKWLIGSMLVDEGRLILATGNQTIPIRKKLMSVLTCLIEHYPHVVETEYLIEQVWGPSTSMGRVGVNHAVWNLRQLMRIAGNKPMIETIPKRGYRLLVAPRLTTGVVMEDVVTANDESEQFDGALRSCLTRA